MIICNDLVNKKFSGNGKNGSTLLKVGIIIGVGLAIHNFPEGLAIGSGFNASSELGIALAIAICIHDFPERLSYGCSFKTRRL